MPDSSPEDEEELLRYYKQLPEKEKIRLVSRAETIADMYAEAAPEPVQPMIAIKHSMYKVSAGTGERLSDYDDWDEIEIPDTPEALKKLNLQKPITKSETVLALTKLRNFTVHSRQTHLNTYVQALHGEKFARIGIEIVWLGDSVVKH